MYLVFMMLFIPGRAMTSWWNGSYTTGECRNNLSQLCLALIHTLEKERQFPSSENIEHLIQNLDLKSTSNRSLICPFERSFYSGKRKI